MAPRRAARWEQRDRRWIRAGSPDTTHGQLHSTKFSRFNSQAPVPTYDDETYEKHLNSNAEWTKEETDYLVELYGECGGKWAVVSDRYEFAPPSSPLGAGDGVGGDEDVVMGGNEQQQKEASSQPQQRSMEDLKARFYGVSAVLLALGTPISSMTAPEYALYETLSNFNPGQELSRKKLAEGHLLRRQNEIDEETVLLSELQRIMVNQVNVDGEREELRRRLDYPHANTNGYQYTTSQALTGLWQQLLAADRMKKNQRLRPTGNATYDGFPGATPTSARPRDSNAGLHDSATHMHARRPTRDSIPSASTPQSSLPVDLSKGDLIRFGVVHNQDKLPSGVTFASDKLSKPRIAKSTVQTDKIAAVLQHAQVPDLIALPTPPVVEQFEAIMAKVHVLLDLRKLREKEEQEVRVREAEAGGTEG